MMQMYVIDDSRVPLISAFAVLLLAACGEGDLGQAGRNAAWAAVEAAEPQFADGLRAIQSLKQAAESCGWEDVDATAMARSSVGAIEEPIARAAATSLVEDLIVGDAVSPPRASRSDCSPETRRALEAQIAALLQGNDEAGESG